METVKSADVARLIQTLNVQHGDAVCRSFSSFAVYLHHVCVLMFLILMLDACVYIEGILKAPLEEPVWKIRKLSRMWLTCKNGSLPATGRLQQQQQRRPAAVHIPASHAGRRPACALPPLAQPSQSVLLSWGRQRQHQQPPLAPQDPFQSSKNDYLIVLNKYFIKCCHGLLGFVWSLRQQLT